MTSSRNQSVKLRLLWVACLLNGPLNLTLRERPSWIVAKATHYGSFIKAGIYYPQRVWKHFCSYKKKDRCTLYAIITGSGRQCAKNSRPWTSLFLPAWELNAFTLQSLQLRRLNPLWRQFNGSRVSIISSQPVRSLGLSSSTPGCRRVGRTKQFCFRNSWSSQSKK
jgi:hypothetical protein